MGPTRFTPHAILLCGEPRLIHTAPEVGLSVLKATIRNDAVRFGEHTRLACSDRRPRRSAELSPQSLNGEGADALSLFREGAECLRTATSTRGACAPHLHAWLAQRSLPALG